MDWGKNDNFLFNMAYNRFLVTLKEFAENDGMDSQFVERVLDRYIANPGALGDILADYPDRQAELRLRCLLRASKEVHKEITQHFESNRKASRKALIHEMPTDKYLGLRLQAEYLLRYVRGIDEEELAKLKEAGVLRDKLLEAIKQAEQLQLDQEEISQQIQTIVQVEVDSRLLEIKQLNHEMEAQQNEIKKVGDQVKAMKTNTASVEELQAVKDILQQDRQHSSEIFKQLSEQLRAKPSRPELEDVRAKLADHREAVDQWNRHQVTFSDQLKGLEDRVQIVTVGVASSREDINQNIQSSITDAKEDLQRSLQAQLDRAQENCNQYKKDNDRRLDTFASSEALNQIKMQISEADKLQKRLDQKVENIVQSSREKEKEESEKRDRIQLDESLKNCEQFKKDMELRLGKLASSDELSDLKALVNATDEQRKQLEQDIQKKYDDLRKKHNEDIKRLEETVVSWPKPQKGLSSDDIRGIITNELKDLLPKISEEVASLLKPQMQGRDGTADIHQPSISENDLKQIKALVTGNTNRSRPDMEKIINQLFAHEQISKEGKRMFWILWEENQSKK